MSKRRRKGVRKGQEADQRWSPPERNGIGTYGTHRTGAMEEQRAARLARIRGEENMTYDEMIAKVDQLQTDAQGRQWER